LGKHLYHVDQRVKKYPDSMPWHLRNNDKKDLIDRDPAYYDDDELELLAAIDKFRTKNPGVYVSITTIMQLMKKLGWEKQKKPLATENTEKKVNLNSKYKKDLTAKEHRDHKRK